MCTPMDLLFLLLPFLDAARQKGGNDGVFCELSQILDQSLPEVVLEMAIQNCEQLRCVSDIRCFEGKNFYRLNDSKVLFWLECKVDLIREKLLEAHDSPFAKMSEMHQLSYCIGILSEYLEQHWSMKLAQHLHVELQEAPKEPFQPHNISTMGPPAKKQKVGEQNCKSTTKGQSRIAADLEKNAVGSKKITSFFCSK